MIPLARVSALGCGQETRSNSWWFARSDSLSTFWLAVNTAAPLVKNGSTAISLPKLLTFGWPLRCACVTVVPLRCMPTMVNRFLFEVMGWSMFEIR